MRPAGTRVWQASRLLGTLSALCFGVSGCNVDVLNSTGPVGLADSQILVDSVVIMLAIIVPTAIAIVGVGWWFRASNRSARYDEHFVYSGRVELVIWSIPFLTVMLLGGVIWIGSHQLDPAAPIASDKKPLNIQVVSLDWKWLFLYPDQRVASVNELVAPVGVPLKLSLTSGSVMTVFFVPRLGSMIYTMNGMSDELNLQGDQVGEYRGEAAHFSGDGFPDMHFPVKIVSPGDFDGWVKQATSAEPPFDDAAYLQLSKQSADVPPQAHPLADDRIYDKIVTQELPPGPGPEPMVRPTPYSTPTATPMPQMQRGG